MSVTGSPDTGSIRRRITGDSDDTAPANAGNGQSNVNLDDGGGDVNGNGDGGGSGGFEYSYRPSAPAHRKIKESPLSSDAIFRQSHAGLLNLCVVVLVALNSRLIIENLMKYGLLIRAGFWFSSKSLRDWPLFMCGLILPVFPLVAFVIEKLAQRQSISDLVVVLLHTLNAGISVFYPVLVILSYFAGVILLSFSTLR